MNTLPRGLFRVTGWTFACGIVTTLLQMVFVPMALGQWYIDHLAQMNMAFNALALVLVIAVGLLVMRRLTYKMIFLSAIFYPMDALPENLTWIIKHFNPMYFYIGQLRDLVYYGRMPGHLIILAGCVTAILALVVGMLSFLRSKDKFILYI